MENLSRKLIEETASILREKLLKFDFKNPSEDPIKIAHILAQSCIKENGLGLAANQIGLPVRACIIKAEEMLCMFNPEIVDASFDKQSYKLEGCLSFPKLFIKIKRPDIIKVRFTLPNGNTETRKFVGLTSKIIQHEIDHLNGILFTDRATYYHLEQALNKRKLQNRRDKKNKSEK